MAQTIQLFGTIVHQPKLVVLDEPFSGLDAINQGRLEHLIRDEAAAGTTVIFSTHVIPHAERLCERIAIIAGGQIRFEGLVAEARDRLRPQVRLRTRTAEGGWRRALPADARSVDGVWQFELPKGGIEPLLKALIDGGAGHRGIVDRAAAACTTPSSPSPAKAPRARWRTSWPIRGSGMMSLLEAAWVIARRDFVATVYSRSFILFLLVPLLIFGAAFFVARVAERATATPRSRSSQSSPTAPPSRR